MKFFKILTIVLLFTSTNFGQNIVLGKIIDKKSKTPIAYVNIGVLGTNTGTVSNDNGLYQLNIQSIKDTVIFSSIGYKTLNLSAEEAINNELIEMNSTNYALEDIEITSFNFDKELVLGERNESKRGKSFGFGNAQLGTELGALIRIKKETFIKSAHFVLNHAKGDSLLLRINIYDYKNRTIGEKVLKHNIIINESQHKGTYNVDLSDYEIILKNDVLLAIEWLKDFDDIGNKHITFDTKKSKTLKGTYIKYSSNSDFKKLSHGKNLKPCLYFIGKQNSK